MLTVRRCGASTANPIAATKYGPADALITALLTTGIQARPLTGRGAHHDDRRRDACGANDGTPERDACRLAEPGTVVPALPSTLRIAPAKLSNAAPASR